MSVPRLAACTRSLPSGQASEAEVLAQPVELERRRSRAGVVVDEEVEHGSQLDIAAVAATIGHQALVDRQHRLDQRLHRELLDGEADPRLQQPEHGEGTLQPATEIEEPPGRTAYGALGRQTGERGQVDEDHVEIVDGRITARQLGTHPRQAADDTPVVVDRKLRTDIASCTSTAIWSTTVCWAASSSWCSRSA